jgi:site-specific DNA-methyltransferase (adenine-specific)
MSGQNIERAAAVCAAARENQARFGHLQEEMDCGHRSINSAWRLLRAMKDLDAIPQPPAPPPGKYMDEILLGDCLDWLRTFHDDTFDACWTDPYFGVGFRYGGVQEPINRDPVAYWNWLRPIYQEIVRVCKPGALIAVNQSLYYWRHLAAWFGEDIDLFAYCKTFIPIYNMSDFTWSWHPIVMTHKPGGKRLYPRKKCCSLNHYTSKVPCDDVARLHPCPLPPDFCETFLKSFTVENAWVLDAFCGSGSIPLACFNTGRRFTGIELREDYVDLARKRLWKAGQDVEERRRKAE